jgi:ATP-dependent Clp protease protease subunit
MENNFLNVKPKKLKLVINSEGGEMHQAFSIINMIKCSKIPVHTYGLGMVCSGGLAIFMAGAKGNRRIFEHSVMMSHQWYAGFEGKEHDVNAWQKSNTIVGKNILKLYKDCTGMTEKFIKNKLLGSSDFYFTTEEAVQYGFADEVITDSFFD